MFLSESRLPTAVEEDFTAPVYEDGDYEQCVSEASPLAEDQDGVSVQVASTWKSLNSGRNPFYNVISRSSSSHSVSGNADERAREVHKEVNAPGDVECEAAFQAHSSPCGDCSNTSPFKRGGRGEDDRDGSPSSPSALEASKHMDPPLSPPRPEVTIDAPTRAATLDPIRDANCDTTAGYRNMSQLQAGKVTDGSHSVYTVPWPEPMYFYLPTKGQLQFTHVVICLLLSSSNFFLL